MFLPRAIWIFIASLMGHTRSSAIDALGFDSPQICLGGARPNDFTGLIRLAGWKFPSRFTSGASLALRGLWAGPGLTASLLCSVCHILC